MMAKKTEAKKKTGTPTCATCRHWLPNPAGGRCRRYPPVALGVMSDLSEQPKTRRNDSCGEHAPR